MIKKAYIKLILAVYFTSISLAFAEDKGGITVVSNFYAHCGLAVEFYDKNNDLLLSHHYIKTKDYHKILFVYEPWRYGIPIDSYITLRTQFPAMVRPGCRAPKLFQTYRIPWVKNTKVCIMVNEVGISPCEPNLLYDVPPRFISRYPPVPNTYWLPSQKEYYWAPR